MIGRKHILGSLKAGKVLHIKHLWFIAFKALVEETVVQDVTDEEDNVIVIEDEGDGSDDEYLRSIANLDETEAVTKQEFNDDKNEILQIISELAVIMETKDTLAWLKDIHDSFEKFGIGRALWNYKNKDFGLVDEHYAPIFKDMIQVL